MDYVLDIQPQLSAYKVQKKEMFNTLQSLYEDIQSQSAFVTNNKCWVYAFNFALIRRHEAIKRGVKRLEIIKFKKANEKLLETIEEFTHELKGI